MGTLAGFKIGNFWNLPLICTMDLHQDLCRCLHNILADCLHQYTPEAQFSNLLKILSIIIRTCSENGWLESARVRKALADKQRNSQK